MSRARALALLLLLGCSGQAIDPDSEPPTNPPGTGGTPPPTMVPSDDPPRPPGPPPVRCEASFVGARALVRLTAGEIDSSLRDVFPEAASAFSLGLSDPLDGHGGFGFVNPSRLLVGEDSAEKLLAAAKAIAGAVVAPANLASLAGRIPCVAGARDAACAGEVIKRYGRRLFRRPLTADEQQRYVALHDTVAAGSDFATGLKWALIGLLQSPHTLYRRQVGTPAGGMHKLTQHELASELAYTYTGSTPTEELLGKADRNELGSPEALVAEARRLLETPAGRTHLGEFFRLWLSYDLVTANQRDNVPGFATLRDSLAGETAAFLDRVIFTDKGGLSALLTAPYTMLDGALAGYYGLPAPAPVAGSRFVQVMRPAGRGIGLLAQGSILAERSQSLNSSPTRRGILIRQKLLCLSIPQQPAMVPDLPPPGAGWRTTRQRFETSHAQGGCAGCHRFFDPLGFGLEHFDEGGRYRATENGEPIDPSALAIDDAGQTLFTSKAGEEELSMTLAARPEVAACTAETLVKYLFGLDRDCLAATARNDFTDGKIGYLDLAARAAAAPHFWQRRE